MSENTAEGLKSSLNEPAPSVEATVNDFVETTVNALRQSEAPESAVSAVQEAGAELSETVSATAESAAQARSRARETEQRVAELEQTVEELRDDQDDHTEDLRDDLCDERERSAKERAELRQRVTEVEERVTDVEDDSNDANPRGSDATRPSLTPIERLSVSNEEDVNQHVTASIERAVSLFENLCDWGRKTPKGYTLRPADNPKELLEADRDESLAWQQYYRAAEALEQLSKGAVTFFDHDRHGKTAVLHEDSEVYDRLTGGNSHSQMSLAAD